MFAWGFGSGTYFVDPDAQDTVSTQKVYCAVLPDGSSGWTKMLQYDRSAYTPTASAVGTISTSSTSSIAKLADVFINALVGVGKSKEYRFRASGFTTAQHVPEQDLFVVSSAVFEDTIFGQGIFSGTSQILLVCVSPARSSCTFVTTASKGYMNSVLLGVSAAGNFCNQFISDFQGGPSRCLGHFEADDLGNIDFIPSQTTKRCIVTGPCAEGESVNQGVMLTELAVWVREYPRLQD